MTMDEFKRSLRDILHDAVKGGLPYLDVYDAALDEIEEDGWFDFDPRPPLTEVQQVTGD
jgi:hypothetical protein